MSEPQRVLAAAAHADDEILGPGATLAMHAAAGAELTFLVFSTSVGSRPGTDNADVAEHRLQCARQVAHLYGAKLHVAELPDNRFDTIAHLDIVRQIEKVITEANPQIIYTHCGADLSRDHQIVAHATATAARPVPNSPVRTMLSYEVRSATEWSAQRTFHPTWYQRLDDAAVEMKLQALRIYASEMHEWPHSRSVPAVQAQLAERGARIGADAAEAFEVLRHLP